MIEPRCREKFAALDRADPLASARDAFVIADGVIYMDGNSLGVPPRSALDAVRAAAETEWAGDLVGAWNSRDWIGLPGRLGDRIGRLVGAVAGQVLVCDSTSVNLNKLLATALGLRPGRRTVLSTRDNFPTDLYVAEGLVALLGSDRCRLRTAVPEELLAAIDEDTAVVMLTHVDFRTGAMFDLEQMTAAIQARGALVLWGLAHSAGAVPLSLDAANVDLAVGCGYKFLNGGPGAPAFLYVAERHLSAARQPLSGWMGHARPFAFEPGYEGAPGVERFLTGTPSVLACRALEGALDVFDGVAMADVRAKSIALSQAFIELVTESEALAELRLASPADPERRGSQVSFAHPDAYALKEALVDMGVVGDFREPDLLRLGITPLYLRHVDIFDAALRMERAIVEGRHLEARFHHRSAVT